MANKLWFIPSSILCLAIAGQAAAATESFSELEFGFDHITYQEHLSDVGRIGKDGRLEQSVSVTNPTIRNLSYSAINDHWGLIVRGSSTVATSLADEQWSVGSHGVIQENEFKLKQAEIGVALAYQLSQTLQIAGGANFTSSGFTRSSFTKVEPGASRFSAAIAPATFDTFAGAINEDQYTFLATLLLRYDTRTLAENSPWSYYAELGASVPLYVLIQNTSLPNDSLNDSFNGWGINGGVGARYQLNKKVSIKLGLHSQYSERNQIQKMSGEARIRVPNISYTTVGAGLGISWEF